MTTIGDLDQRVTFRRLQQVGTNPFNEPIFDLVDIATVSAKRTDVSDSERYAAGTVGSAILSRFVVRSNSVTRGVKHTDALVHDGRDWNIDGIKRANDGRGRFLEITAKAAGV